MKHSDYIELVNQVKAHDYHYFVENSPVISDEDYDRLYFQLQDYEQQYPDKVLPDSPTQFAHGEVKNGHKQIRRRTPMLSTQKAQSIEQVEKWMKQTAKAVKVQGSRFKVQGDVLFTVEWKYDGVSASLVYQDGKLIEASYGKGMEGNDCLELIRQIPSVPQTINATGRVEVRGEVLCPFANLSKTGYKNCRSAAAGILADTQSTDGNLLEFHPYWSDVNKEQTDNPDFVPTTNISVIGELQGDFLFMYDGQEYSINAQMTRNHIDHDNITPDVINDIILLGSRLRPTLPFPVDGLVIKVADMDVWESLGATEHHPKYSIAYKFAAQTAETTITRIEITTGKTGRRTPVAYFEPVVINGATYQKASVGSEKKLEELDLHVGDKVTVSLRNDVIPHIETKASPLPSPEEGGSTAPFIGSSESGENSRNPETETPSETLKRHARSAGRFLGTMLAGLVAIAGAATILYCCVGLIFFLPLLFAKR